MSSCKEFEEERFWSNQVGQKAREYLYKKDFTGVQTFTCNINADNILQEISYSHLYIRGPVDLVKTICSGIDDFSAENRKQLNPKQQAMLFVLTAKMNDLHRELEKMEEELV